MARVLVVEDEPGIAELLEDRLSEDGHRVVTAANGRVAIERLRVATVDLIVLDFMMPVMDGAAFLDHVRTDGSAASVPVIVMSSMPREVVDQRIEGYAAFLRKPFNLEDVIALVEKVLAAAG